MRLKRRGSVSMDGKLRAASSPSSPAPAIRDPPRGGRPIIRAADERRPARRYLGASASRAAPRLIDLAIALPIALLGVLEAVGRETPSRWLVAAAVNGAAVALPPPLPAPRADRRRSPCRRSPTTTTYDTDPLSPFLAELILMFTVAYELAFAPRSRATWLGVAYVAIDFGSGRIERIVQALAQCGFYLLAWGIGRIVRGQEERRAAAERHVVRVELEREEQARSAVVEERARIARELHDAVAHSVSVMVLQAGGVRRLLGTDPDPRPRP